MATPVNLELLAASGYAAADLAGARPADLVVAVDADDAAGAIGAAEGFLAASAAPADGGLSGGRADPRDLDGALARLNGANLALISLPGAYAAREARACLERGLHVMLFSDNVSLDDEIALKTFARTQGLLVMGPDCGTAIINGVPLCFANTVARGPIGLVAASGTGLQETTCLIDRFGSGISQAIGTGGRDLKNDRVGGLATLTGIEALAADPATKVIVVLSKPPAPAVAAKVAAALEAAGKPAVVHFIGLPPPPPVSGSRLRWATNLEETACLAVGLAGARPYVPSEFDAPAAEIDALVARESARIGPGQKYLRGYFTGGTLADEAWLLLHALTGAVHSNNQTDPRFAPPDPRVSVGHTVVDLGDDVFTVGRPHPMIDPSTRTERIDAERNDASVAVVLVDCVLGYGSHPDPAGALAPSLAAAKAAAAARGGYLPVVASITGTPGDFQGFAGQKAKLEAAGAVVMPSNHQAALLAARILAKVGAR
jgi:succinyl-CoA synthetase alpha subunit